MHRTLFSLSCQNTQVPITLLQHYDKIYPNFMLFHLGHNLCLVKFLIVVLNFLGHHQSQKTQA